MFCSKSCIGDPCQFELTTFQLVSLMDFVCSGPHDGFLLALDFAGIRLRVWHYLL